MTPRAPAQPGDVVAGKYVVKGVIGRGGVGVVVAADHKTLRCPVALKFLRPEIAYDPQVVQRFLREARAAARLRSEHVARVMDADSTEDGAAYMVMELLEGRDFAAVLKDEGPLPVPAAVDYLLQACDAVAEAHALGIVHRDLKSANLFLTRRADGTPLVKVLDFGLSKVERSPSQHTITTDHDVVGSPHFMSPEQMRSSREADARSDIWSLGVVLYTLLAGRKPFEGTYLTEVCSAVLSGSPPALPSVRPEVPAGLAGVVDRCLRLEPEERYQTVTELAAALAPFAPGAVQPASAPASIVAASALAPSIVARPTPAEAPSTPRAEPPRPRPVSRRGAWIALVAVAVAATAIVLVVRGTRAGDAPPAVALALPEVVVTPPSVERSASAAPASASTATAPPSRAPAAPRPGAGAGRRASVPAAPPAPAASSGPARRAASPRTEEDVILGLPH